MKGFKRDILSQRLIIITRYEKGSEVRVCYRRTYRVLWRLDGSIVESLKSCKWMQRLMFSTHKNRVWYYFCSCIEENVLFFILCKMKWTRRKIRIFVYYDMNHWKNDFQCKKNIIFLNFKEINVCSWEINQNTICEYFKWNKSWTFYHFVFWLFHAMAKGYVHFQAFTIFTFHVRHRTKYCRDIQTNNGNTTAIQF